MSRLQIHSISFFIGCGLLLLVLLGAGVVYAAGNPLEVYNDASYSGMWCYSVSAGPNNIASSCNDQVSSVALLSGWSVRLYRDANQSGPSRCFSASDANLTDNTYEDGSPMNDTASSFILYQQAVCPPLEVHNDANYTGSWCYSVGAGPANVASTCNDQVSSILLTPGWSVRVYRDANQSGPSRCFTASDPNLTDNTYEDGSAINDTVSSLNLYTQGSCPVLPDTTPPSGNITSPAIGAAIVGFSPVNFTANASDNVSGSGVNRVEFYVAYNGTFHAIGQDTNAPYQIIWQPPTDLRTQLLSFTIHVYDNANNRVIDPGGYRQVAFTTTSTENWVSNRAYLNQLALGSNGWSMCSMASIAMVRAQAGLIGSDFASLRDEANQVWNTGLRGPGPSQVRDYLNKNGMIASVVWDQNKNNHWNKIKQEIDANRAVILNSNSDGGALTSAGHYIVVVGYREATDPQQREIIVYDPFGQWTGVIDKYARNSALPDPPGGTIGRWVFYRFNSLGTIYSVVAQRKSGAVIASTTTSLPDEVFVLENYDVVTYTGHGQNPYPVQIYLPFIIK